MKNYFYFFTVFAFCLSLVVRCSGLGENWQDSKNASSALVVITSSDDINNPLYIGKIPSFINYNNREYITNKPLDTLRLSILPWDLLTVGAKSNVLDTLYVQQGDTLFLNLQKGNIKKFFKTKKTEKWSYNEILKEEGIKRFVDSLNHSYFEKKTIPKDIPPLIVSNGKHLLLFELSDLIFKESQRESLNYKVPQLIEANRKLIQKYEELNSINEVDTNKANLDLSLLKRDIANKMIFFYSKCQSPILKAFIFSELIKTEQKNRSDFNFLFLNHQIDLFYKSFDTKSDFLKASDLYAIYDNIAKDFDSIWIEKARMLCLEKMIMEKGSMDSINKYFDQFNTEYNNTYFKQYMNDTYFVDAKTFYDAPYNIDFVDAKKNKKDWEQLKSSLQGHVIYVDYWASWCGPCRRAMPAARKLKELYKDQNIAFVYFSIDKDEEKWITASKEEKISLHEHNYLIVNHVASNLKNKLKIDGVPRYLLYNKEGKLVHHDAPSPDSDEIQVLFDTLLTE